MQTRKKVVSLLVIAGAIGLALSTAGAAETKVALIPAQGQYAPAKELVDFVEVALSGQEGIALIERAQIKKVLAEQELNASGLVDPANAVKVGKLLGADILLFIESRAPVDEKGKPDQKQEARICRVRAVEARTGIILCSALEQQQDLLRDAGKVAEVAALAAAKSQVPMKERRHVALLDFRSEELSHQLDGLALALGVFLVNDLAASPSVVVLERESLERLRDEEALAGLELDLATSSVLLRGTVKRVGDAHEELYVRVDFNPKARGKQEQVEVTGPADDVPALRKRIVEAIVRQLRVRPPAAAKADPAKEAQAFLRRGRAEFWFGVEGVAGLLEAAIALDPKKSVKRDAANVYKRMAWQYDSMLDDDCPHSKRAGYAVAGVTAALRQAELSYDLSHADLLQRRANKGFADLGWAVWAINEKSGLDGREFMKQQKKLPEVRQILAERGKVCLRQYREALAFAEEAWRDGRNAGAWWRVLGDGLRNFHLWTPDAREWSALVKEAILLAERPELKELAGYKTDKNLFALDGVRDFLPPTFVAPILFGDTPGYKAVIRETVDWTAQRKDPFIRVMACAGACTAAHGWGTDELARLGLDTISDELSPTRGDRKDTAGLGPLVDDLFYVLYDEPAERDEYAEKILRPMLEPGQLEVLLEWRSSMEDWIRWLGASDRMIEDDPLTEKYDKWMSVADRLEKAYAIAEQYDKALAAPTDDKKLAARAADHKRMFRAKWAALAQKLNRPLPLSGRVDGWSFERIIQSSYCPDDPFSLNEMSIHDDRLFILWHRRCRGQRRC